MWYLHGRGTSAVSTEGDIIGSCTWGDEVGKKVESVDLKRHGSNTDVRA